MLTKSFQAIAQSMDKGRESLDTLDVMVNAFIATRELKDVKYEITPVVIPCSSRIQVIYTAHIVYEDRL